MGLLPSGESVVSFLLLVNLHARVINAAEEEEEDGGGGKGVRRSPLLYCSFA